LKKESVNLNLFEVFPWNKKFELGIKEIDDQHKKIIKLLNKLATSITQPEINDISDAFSELADYADYHFTSEEEIWSKYIKDDNLVYIHKVSHDSFLPKVLEIQKKNEHKPLHDTIEEILLFLIRWLVFHIIGEDKYLSLIIMAMKKGKTLEEAAFISEKEMKGSNKVLLEAILTMYNTLSSRTIKLMRERNARIKAENKLKIVNEMLEQLSITDQLTSLYNRRHFKNIFNLELKRAIRFKTIFSVVLFDIDYFKRLNDTYGHQSGDMALISIGKCLKEICKRPSDFAFRIGGEEFTIIIADSKMESALNISEKLQNKLETLQIVNEKSDVSKYMTISIGIVSLIPNTNDTIDTIMKEVDEKLYLAKEKGRNQIVN
jgi:diguanylate cyclase (GGDEF)-like protein/hemerythrin-like metal-binding protein